MSGLGVGGVRAVDHFPLFEFFQQTVLSRLRQQEVGRRGTPMDDVLHAVGPQVGYSTEWQRRAAKLGANLG
jgi:hypothetical protein